jgi:sulfate permease, SulP family
MATTTLDEQDHVPLRRWQEYRQPLQLILQTFSSVSDKPEDFWERLVPSLIRQEYRAGTTLYKRGDPPNGFYLLETGMLKAEYRLQQGQFSELILAGTTCGELPFFSGTNRTSTTTADTDCVTWVLNEENWERLQNREGEVTQELLKISLKLTSERMDAITK